MNHRIPVFCLHGWKDVIARDASITHYAVVATVVFDVFKQDALSFSAVTNVKAQQAGLATKCSNFFGDCFGA